MWQPFDEGATVGRPGSEGGIIVRDKEHDAGSRITLEQNCQSAPRTVTCGTYGGFFHTRLLGPEAVAECPAMCDGLAAVLDIIPHDNPDADDQSNAVTNAISAFVDRFP